MISMLVSFILFGKMKFLLYILFSASFVISQYDYEIPDYVRFSERPKDDKAKPLPQRQSGHPTPCNESIQMDIQGFYQFNLIQSKELCSLLLFGTFAFNCTVALLCDDLSTFPPSEDGRCNNGWFEVSDGLGGEILGCGGNLQLYHPRKATNGGRDLYLRYKGMSGDSTCAAYCEEDAKLWKNLPQIETRELLPSKKKPKNPIKKCECGIKHKSEVTDKPTGRIFKGKDADPFEYPWLAALVNTNETSPYYKNAPFCSVTLISDSHVLTAAHCTDTRKPSDMEIIFHAHVMNFEAFNKSGTGLTSEQIQGSLDQIPGAKLPNQTDEDEDRIRVGVKKISMHPLYNNQDITKGYDAAILHLNRKIKLGSELRVSPICLHPPGEWYSPKVGETLDFAGWGLTMGGPPLSGSRILQKTKNKVLNRHDCSKVTVSQFFPEYNDFKLYGDQLICFGNLDKDGPLACRGDSGGSVLSEIDNHFFQTGIVSFGSKQCNLTKQPQLLTNVREVIQWVYFTTQGARFCKNPKDTRFADNDAVTSANLELEAETTEIPTDEDNAVEV